jgi:hypothetical protein
MHSPSGQFGQITYPTRPAYEPTGNRAPGNGQRPADLPLAPPTPRLSPEVPAPGSRASWPLNDPTEGYDREPDRPVPTSGFGNGIGGNRAGGHGGGGNGVGGFGNPATFSTNPSGFGAAAGPSFGGTSTGPPPFGGTPSGPSGFGGAAEVPRPIDLPRQREGRVTPPWQADDLPTEPPTLRLVEPAPIADPALSLDRAPVDDLGADLRFDPPALRLVGGETEEWSDRTSRRNPQAVDEPADVPVTTDGDDSDLLIFAACRSAWFTDPDDVDEQLEWATAADRGWEAAEQAARPAVGAETGAGLPRRVPQKNLVPGSPEVPAEEEQRPLRIVRDAASIAAHTSGYFSGYRRGQEVGGYSVGGRPGRESLGGWDFSRETSDGEFDYLPSGEYEYRSARR